MSGREGRRGGAGRAGRPKATSGANETAGAKAASGAKGGARAGATRAGAATRAGGVTGGATGAGAAGRGEPGAWLATPPRPGRIAAYLGLLVLGAVVGTAGALAQGGLFPGGLILALLGSAGLFYGGRTATGTSLGVGAPAAGWLIAVIGLSLGRPEGDGVFAAGLGPVVYLLGGALVAVMCATMSRSPQPVAESRRLGK
ncbi:DUF6113 family protein [Streptomyces sp. NPDC058155]|uniref:DUF6113 family protein n=1 Tax=Streptomyces sp. NPDC058155 TaxID=3346359 RepID=UPI0036EE9814